MNLNKSITAVAIAAMLLSMGSFTSEAETIRGTNYKKHNNLKVVKIHSKHHHSHDKYIGENRYETSAKILANYKNKDTLILVDASRNMSDGLSAAALSGKLNANIVPINPKNIDKASKKMIKNAKKIVLIGGYNAIPKEFEKNLSGKKIIRIGGEDRVETSKNIANYIGNYKKAYIVNGYTGQADAMSIAPVSARDISPIILTKHDKININKEKNVDYTVIGGVDAVSNNIQNETSSDRIGGKNRYETNRMILDKFYKNRNSISFCNGETLVDALSGTYFARNHGIALINSEENLYLLKNINTNQLGGIPLDIRFVIPSANISEKINDKNPAAKGDKLEEKKDNLNEKDKNKDKNTSKDKDKNPDTEKNTSGEQILDNEQISNDSQEPENNQTSTDNETKVKSSNMLIEGEDFNKEIKTLKAFSDAKKIVFNNEMPNKLDKIEHLKLDKEKSGSIVAYIKNNTIYVSSKDKIYANEYSYGFMKDFKNIEEVDLSNLDTSKVVDMSSLFNGCTNLKTINVDNLDTSNVNNMRSLFANCTNLESIDLRKLNTSKVTEMSNMFLECQSLKELDLKNLDTSKVKDMSYMFGDCYGLTKLNLDNLNTSNVENMVAMFTNCKNLKEIDLDDIDTENVKTMSYMFSGCLGLESLDLSNFRTSNVENMSYMFAACEGLKNIDLEHLNTSKVNNMDGMLRGCTNINASINIENVVKSYDKVFEHCAVDEGSKLTVNYINDKTKIIVKNMINTKSSHSNVEIGDLVD